MRLLISTHHIAVRACRRNSLGSSAHDRSHEVEEGAHALRELVPTILAKSSCSSG